MSFISLTSRKAAYRSDIRVLIITVFKEGEFKAPEGCPNCRAKCRLLGLSAKSDVEPGVKP